MLSMKKMLSDIANSVKDLAQKLGLIDDYVVAKGTSGIWTYRKWNSGTAECWGAYNGIISGWSAWGNLYEGTIQTVNYPFTFSELPTSVQVNTAYGSSNNQQALSGIEIRSNPVGYTTGFFQFYPLRPNSGTANVDFVVGVSVKGRWK